MSGKNKKRKAKAPKGANSSGSAFSHVNEKPLESHQRDTVDTGFDTDVSNESDNPVGSKKQKTSNNHGGMPLRRTGQ